MIQARPGGPGKKEPRWCVPTRRHNVAQSEIPIKDPKILEWMIPRVMHRPDVRGEPRGPGWSVSRTGRTEVVSAHEERGAIGLRIWVA